jgi:hypothetical protein
MSVKTVSSGEIQTTEAVGQILALKDSGVGKVLVILANGPSLAEIKTEKLCGQKSVDLFAINRPDKRVWPTKYWGFYDTVIYHRHLEEWQWYGGTVITSTSTLRYEKNVAYTPANVVLVRRLDGMGFSRDLVTGFHLGRSSTYAALQTALYMNYDQVYILGHDMGTRPDGRMWFNNQAMDCNVQDRATRFDHEATFFDYAATQLNLDTRDRIIFSSNYNVWAFRNRFNNVDQDHVVEEVLAAAAKLDKHASI